MKKELIKTRLFVSFENLEDDQSILEKALKHEIIPLRKYSAKCFFKSDDIVKAAFLNDLVSRGYSQDCTIKAALALGIISFQNDSSKWAYIFETSSDDIALINFLDDLKKLKLVFWFRFC